MQNTAIGDIITARWEEIPKHFLHAKLGEFVVMPDHFHGIIIISDDMYIPKENREWMNSSSGTESAGNAGFPDQQEVQKIGSKKEEWAPGTLGVIINQFKRICTLQARQINPEFAWQRLYHDRIIRNEQEYKNVTAYIKNNPLNWK